MAILGYLAPFAALALAGFFNPFGTSILNFFLIGAMVAGAISIALGWRITIPNVLSVRELAALVSFPTAPERFPLEFARLPVEAETATIGEREEVEQIKERYRAEGIR